MTDMTTANPSSRTYLDVSKLPSSAVDHRSPIWWGNALLLCIETSMFVLAIVSYFYFRRNFEHWPPPKWDVNPPIINPLPRLGYATVNTIVLVLSLIPMIIADRACLKMREKTVQICATIGCLMSITSIYLRFREFGDLVVRWDANAYGSVIWTLLGLHLLHLIVLTCEDGLMSAYIWIHGLDDKHARDIRVTAVYWYWVVAVWLVLYWVVYWSPRMM